MTPTKLTDRVPVFRLQRQSGVSSPTITRQATSCSHRCLIFRDERAPVASPKISNVSIIRGSVLSVKTGRVAPQLAFVMSGDRPDVEFPHGIPQKM